MALDDDMRRRIRAHSSAAREEAEQPQKIGSSLDWSRVGLAPGQFGKNWKSASVPLIAFIGAYSCISTTSDSLDASVERSAELRAEKEERERRANNPWLLDEPAEKPTPAVATK